MDNDNGFDDDNNNASSNVPHTVRTRMKNLITAVRIYKCYFVLDQFF